jgi:hypothetical protein
MKTIEFLSKALASIPQAAQTWQASISYIVTVLAWAVVTWRVTRNKNLLAKLKDLPPGDRRKILETEMGGAYLASGLSPEGWLAASRQRYYFIGFVSLCVTLLVIIALAGYYALAAASLRSNVSNRTPTPEDYLSRLSQGTRKAYNESLFGPPQQEVCDAYYCVSIYTFQRFYLKLIYSRDDWMNQLDGSETKTPNDDLKLWRYVIIALSGEFRSQVPFVRVTGKERCLGCFTFEAANTTFKMIIASEDSDNCYVEETFTPGEAGSPGISLIWSDNVGTKEDWEFASHLLNFDTFSDDVKAPSKEAITKVRHRLRPNGFSMGEYGYEPYPIGVGTEKLPEPKADINPCGAPRSPDRE